MRIGKAAAIADPPSAKRSGNAGSPPGHSPIPHAGAPTGSTRMLLIYGAAALLPAAAFAEAAVPSQFTVGIELPSQVPVPKPVENALRDMGIGYVGFYVANGSLGEAPEGETTAGLLALCERLGLQFTLDCHHRNPRPDSVRSAAAMGGAFQGVLVDELTHIRLLYPEFRPPSGDEMLADPAGFRDLLDAYSQTEAGLAKLSRHFTDLGAPRVVATEVWPSLLHAAAQAGMTPCPKICKEFYSPVSLAVGLGAALEYGRDLWVDVDMWYFMAIPGHPAEEVRANLELAYWLGADLVYLEGCGYNLFPAGQQGFPFSLMTQIDAERYQLTPHGEMLKKFCTQYLPAHPRPWSFRDLQPTMAVIRFDDTDVGQKSWGVDRLYGTPHLKPDGDTSAWLGLWNVLTWGKTGSDGIAWFKASVPHPAGDPRYHVQVTPSYLTDPACGEHRFFVPLNGAVVFDHLVSYERLRGIPLLFLTGKHVSRGTMAAVRRCVAEGALCVAWGPLASQNGIGGWTRGVKVVRHGRGRFVLTDDFQSRDAVSHYRCFLGRPDEIRYRFAGRTVVLKRITDNSLDVRLAEARPAR